MGSATLVETSRIAELFADLYGLTAADIPQMTQQNYNALLDAKSKLKKLAEKQKLNPEEMRKWQRLLSILNYRLTKMERFKEDNDNKWA